LKQEHLIAGLLGFAALAVGYMLWKDSQPAPADNALPGPPEGTNVPGYPNVAPIAPASFTIDGYNPNANNVPVNGVQLPTVSLGDDGSGGGGCCDEDCDPAGLPVSIQTVPAEVNDKNLADLKSFSQRKVLFTQP